MAQIHLLGLISMVFWSPEKTWSESFLSVSLGNEFNRQTLIPLPCPTNLWFLAIDSICMLHPECIGVCAHVCMTECQGLFFSMLNFGNVGCRKNISSDVDRESRSPYRLPQLRDYYSNAAERFHGPVNFSKRTTTTLRPHNYFIHMRALLAHRSMENAQRCQHRLRTNISWTSW